MTRTRLQFSWGFFFHGAAMLQTCAALAQPPVSTDWRSGIAIRGFDPVAYFIAKAPMPGLAAYELTQDGVTWQFASRANLEAFKRSPQAFLPRYGGYDAEAVSRGVLLRSDPGIFWIEGSALYLFRTTEARTRFVARPEMRTAADAAWIVLEKDPLP